jgi:hypothetical protein
MKHQQKQSVLGHLRTMPIIETACRQAGIGRATFYRWRKEDPEFNKLADEALKEGTLLVNDMAETQLVSAIKDKNISAITYWLKHHHPTYTTRVEVMAHINTNQELTEEQKAIVEQALKLAAGSSESQEDNATDNTGIEKSSS